MRKNGVFAFKIEAGFEGAKMNNLDNFYQAQEIEHLPDARGKIGKSATQMSQSDLPVFDQQGMVKVVAGMSIFLNAFLIMILAVLFIITLVR